jgi:hypothetical protein
MATYGLIRAFRFPILEVSVVGFTKRISWRRKLVYQFV